MSEDSYKATHVAPCTHRHSRLVKKTCVDGTRRFLVVCSICGAAVSQYIKEALIKHPDFVPEEEAMKPVRLQDAMREEIAVLQHARLVLRGLIDEQWEIRRTLYENYIRGNPHWRNLRLQRISIAGGKCERCGKPTKFLECHHITYDRLGNEDIDDLRMFCDPCHKEKHIELKELKNGEAA